MRTTNSSNLDRLEGGLTEAVGPLTEVQVLLQVLFLHQVAAAISLAISGYNWRPACPGCARVCPGVPGAQVHTGPGYSRGPGARTVPTLFKNAPCQGHQIYTESRQKSPLWGARILHQCLILGVPPPLLSGAVGPTRNEIKEEGGSRSKIKHWCKSPGP